MDNNLVPISSQSKYRYNVLHPIRWSRTCFRALFRKSEILTEPAIQENNDSIDTLKALEHSLASVRLANGKISTMGKQRLWFFVSVLKRNIYKFALEGILAVLVLASIAVNINASDGNFKPPLNEFVRYLSEHPDSNLALVNLLETENIKVRPQQGNFVLAAQASTLDPTTDTTLAHNQTGYASNDTLTPGPLLTSVDSAIFKPNYATADAVHRKEISEYTVKGGDSIGRIAAEFGVSVATILHENKLSETDYIKPGQTLKILPTTGLKHEVKDGETLDAISKKYQVNLEIILEYNGIEIPDDIHPGEVIIIPDGKIELPKTQATRIASYSLVDVQRASVPTEFTGGAEFMWPLSTRNVTQYYWSRHRALDISNGQRPQYWASEAGVVELSGWQGAYGLTIIVNHGNGFQTRYAHSSELYVAAGDRVERGQIIGRVGNTGRVYGATGNHIHFELIKNGVKLDPVPYLK
jgi:murein DD-endopeptidase MepM/ murein hydrolase activator NlpD